MQRLRMALIGGSIALLLATVALVWGDYNGLAVYPELFAIPVGMVLILIDLVIIACIFQFFGRRSAKIFFAFCTAGALIGWWWSLRHLLALDRCPAFLSLPLCYLGLVAFLFLLWLGIEHYLAVGDEAARRHQLVVTARSFRRRQVLVVFLLILSVVLLGPSAYNEAADSGEVITTKYGVKVIRTPESRFEELADYPFEPHYVQIDGMRMHYVDEGPREGEVILLLHGEPAWSYLYRHMIPVLAGAGYRVVAPDCIGFGKSDKPMVTSTHSLRCHVDWMAKFIHELQLKNVTLFQHGWGGHLGMRLVAEHPHLFARVMSSNGFWIHAGDFQVPWKSRMFRWYYHYNPWIQISGFIQGLTSRELTSDELYAYDAPFPTNRYKAAVRIAPYLVPATRYAPTRVDQLKARERIKNYKKPFLTAFSDGDLATQGNDRLICQHVPGTRGQKHTTVKGMHFIQEDAGPELAQILIQFIQDNPI